ncbi:hypothetical protein [Bacillus cereus]|nr:hypothetical protein [Bacillus cereus]
MLAPWGEDSSNLYGDKLSLKKIPTTEVENKPKLEKYGIGLRTPSL